MTSARPPPEIGVAASVPSRPALIFLAFGRLLRGGVLPALLEAAQWLRGATVDLQSAWAANVAKGPAGARRPADMAVDNAWAALEGRLASFARLPLEQYPKAKRAAELLDLLFHDGLTFLQLAYAEEWAESEQRLKMIDAQKLEADIDALAGPEFLAEVRRTHALYGKALGITGPCRRPTRRLLLSALGRRAAVGPLPPS